MTRLVAEKTTARVVAAGHFEHAEARGVELPLVGLEAEEVVGVPGADLAGDPLLAEAGVEGDQAALRVEPVEGMPRFTGGAVGAIAYDAVSLFEPSVPLPDADPVGVPTAAFIETDLVLVFDHLTHTLSAAFLLVALVFVWRSFYGMRIESGK